MSESSPVQPDQSRTFLFVNKTGSSDSFSNSKAISKSINRHVQRLRAVEQREKKREALQSVSLTAKRLAGWTWKPSNRRQARPLLLVRDEPTTHGEDDLPKEQSVRADCRLLSANFIEGDCIDPFNRTAIPLDKQVATLLHYYVSGFSIPGLFKTEVDGKIVQRHRHYADVVEIFRGSFSDKMHMFSLLAFSAARMKKIGRSPLEPADSAEYFMHRAITSLRTYFASHTASTVDKQVIVDVHCLCTFEWYFQNYDAALQHLRVVGYLLEPTLGSSNLDQYIREITRYTDVSIAVETLTQPVLRLTWDPGAFPATRWQDVSAGLRQVSGPHMGHGFVNPLQQGFFTSMGNIISDLIPLILVAQYTWICPNSPSTDAEWLNQKAFAILHRLLSVPALPQAGDPFQLQPRREECCRISLIVLLSYICTNMAVVRSGRMNMMRLKNALCMIDADWGRCDHNQMLLWVLATGLFAAHGTVEEEWFLHRAVRVALRLNVQCHAQLQEVIGRYVYLENLQHESLRYLSRKVMEEATQE